MRRFRLGAVPPLRFAVREPGDYCHSRESPLPPETLAGHFAPLSAGPDSVRWNLEKLGNLLQGDRARPGPQRLQLTE
jgi:hypothetical protein